MCMLERSHAETRTVLTSISCFCFGLKLLELRLAGTALDPILFSYSYCYFAECWEVNASQIVRTLFVYFLYFF